VSCVDASLGGLRRTLRGVLIETQRLVLRPIELADLDRFVSLHADREVMRFIGPLDRATAQERLQHAEREWQERRYGMLAVIERATGHFLGRAGLKYWPQFDETELGWVLQRDVWGRGYATEAGSACIEWGFSEFPMPYLTAMVSPENVKSVRVVERLGLTPLRDDVLLGASVVVYALRRATWESRNLQSTRESTASQKRGDEVEDVLAAASRWARHHAEVRGLALVGSWARAAARANSDVDLVLLTDNPSVFTDRQDWTADLGAVGVTREQQWGPIAERRLLLPSGLELEVGVAPTSWAATNPVDAGTRHVIGAGVRVLHDPDGLLQRLVAACTTPA
jgi:RimJ/RimL family protein N-acetyltransferase/predicted nucleotidyltransferase